MCGIMKGFTREFFQQVSTSRKGMLFLYIKAEWAWEIFLSVIILEVQLGANNVLFQIVWFKNSCERRLEIQYVALLVQYF